MRYWNRCDIEMCSSYTLYPRAQTLSLYPRALKKSRDSGLVFNINESLLIWMIEKIDEVSNKPRIFIPEYGRKE